MLLTEEEFKSTFPKDGFANITQSAQNFNEKEFDEYVRNNLVEELGKMHIGYVYDAKDGSYRHVTFITEVKNIHYIVVLDLKNKKIVGHFVLDLNKEYGL